MIFLPFLVKADDSLKNTIIRSINTNLKTLSLYFNESKRVVLEEKNSNFCKEEIYILYIEKYYSEDIEGDDILKRQYENMKLSYENRLNNLDRSIDVIGNFILRIGEIQESLSDYGIYFFNDILNGLLYYESTIKLIHNINLLSQPNSLHSFLNEYLAKIITTVLSRVDKKIGKLIFNEIMGNSNGDKLKRKLKKWKSKKKEVFKCKKGKRTTDFNREIFYIIFN